METGMTSQRADALRLEELPMASDRTAAFTIIRDAGPVAPIDHGGFAAASQETAEYVFRHPELFSSKRAWDAAGSPVPMVPIAFDPPEHTRFRRILQPFFSPRVVKLMLPTVQALAGQLIDNFIDRGECDLTGDFAVPLPAEVFLTLFGLPLADLDRLLEWKDTIINLFDLRGSAAPSEEVVKTAADMHGYLLRHLEERRRQDEGGDLLSQLLADTSEERLTTDELLGMSFLFVGAGLDTVTSSLSTQFAHLAVNAELRHQITRDPALIPDAVEEFLRVEPAVPVLPRVATQDTELGGCPIPAGAPIQVAVGAANRDPAEHPDPDSIDFRRQQRHLSFGAGPHRCLGSHLARMELRVAHQEWHRRIPEYELAPGTRPEVTWPAITAGIDSLPLVFPSGGAAR